MTYEIYFSGVFDDGALFQGYYFTPTIADAASQFTFPVVFPGVLSYATLDAEVTFEAGVLTYTIGPEPPSSSDWQQLVVDLGARTAREVYIDDVQSNPGQLVLERSAVDVAVEGYVVPLPSMLPVVLLAVVAMLSGPALGAMTPRPAHMRRAEQ